MAAPRAITQPYGNGPQSLPNPTPNLGLEADLGQMVEQQAMDMQPSPIAQTPQAQSAMQAMNVETPGTAPVTDPMEDMIAQWEAEDAGGGADQAARDSQSAALAGVDEVSGEPGFIEANIDQFKNTWLRTKAGLAANDTEKANFLRNELGPKNVKVTNGKLYFRREGEGKFKPFDPSTFELLNDLLPDFSREIVQEVGMIPGTAAGVATMNPAVGAVARAANAPAANRFADFVAESAGVPRDENRSTMIEDGIAMGLEASMPFIGSAIAKRIPGTAIYAAAKKAGEQEIPALAKQSQVVAQAAADLNAAGKAVTINGELVGVPGANVNLMGHHLQPDNAQIKQLANIAAQNPRFQNAERQLAEDWGGLLEKTVREIGSKNNKKPMEEGKLAASVVDAVKNAKNAEGAEVGKFKAKAIARLGNKSQPLSDATMQQMSGLLAELPVTKSGKLDMSRQALQRNIVGKFGIKSVGEARSLANTLSDITDSITNKGGLTITDLDKLRNTTGQLGESLRGTQAGREMSILSSNLRKDYRNRIAAGLDNPVDQQAFNQSMDNWGNIMNNVDTLRNVLDEGSSAKAIVSNLFTGKENLAKVKAIKSLSPESFENLKGEFIDQQLQQYASRKSPTGYNSTAFLDAMNKKYGDEFMHEVMGTDLKQVKQLLTVTERLEQSFKGASIDKMSEQQKQGKMNVLIGAIADIKFKAVNGVASWMKGMSGNESAMMDLMTRDGIDKYVANYPGRIDKVSTAQKLKDTLATYKVLNQIDRGKGVGPGKTPAKVLTRGAVNSATTGEAVDDDI